MQHQARSFYFLAKKRDRALLLHLDWIATLTSLIPMPIGRAWFGFLNSRVCLVVSVCVLKHRLVLQSSVSSYVSQQCLCVTRKVRVHDCLGLFSLFKSWPLCGYVSSNVSFLKYKWSYKWKRYICHWAAVQFRAFSFYMGKIKTH